MSLTDKRIREISRMTKRELAMLHVRNGGLMGLSVYLKWTKDELINAIISDETAAGSPS